MAKRQIRGGKYVLAEEPIEAHAKGYTKRAVALLWLLAEDSSVPPSTRFLAVQEILNRGWGKVEGATESVTKLAKLERAERLAADQPPPAPEDPEAQRKAAALEARKVREQRLAQARKAAAK